MPPRQAVKLRQNRPLSAIYLGSSSSIDSSQSSSYSYLANGTPPNLPDLPEPPSPNASISSHDSGLPSPPATNSTGSGSTGDPGSIVIRKRPVSLNSSSSSSGGGGYHSANNSMLNGTGVKTHQHSRSVGGSSSRSSSRLALDHGDDGDDDEDDVENDNENDEDNTARLDRMQSQKSSSENVLALQRVKSLTQRNRMALDKLSSFRLSSPSPAPRASTPSSHLGSRSPLPPPSNQSSSSHSSSSNASSSRLSQPRPSRTHPVPSSPADQGLSGSETEREGSYTSSLHHNHTSSSSSHRQHSSDRSSTSPPPPPPKHATQTLGRSRLTSAPASPARARMFSTSSASSSSSTSQTNPHSTSPRRRKRASMAASSTSSQLLMEEDEQDDEYYPRDARDRDWGAERDITRSALAAVASSRRSPVGTRKARGALPREFRDEVYADGGSGAGASRESLEGLGRGSGRYSVEPTTPHRSTHSTGPTQQQRSPARQQTTGKPSTVRDLTRRHQTRWVSEDMGGPGPPSASTTYSSHSNSLSLDRAGPSYSNAQERGGYSTGRDREGHSSTLSLERERQERRERRQSLRGGSAESALAGGRSLVGEGLRAAGLSRRRDEGGGGGGGGGATDVFVSAREREKRVEWSPHPDEHEGRERSMERDGGSVRTRAAVAPRAATSMADYRYMEREEERRDEEQPTATPSPALRAYKSAYGLARERDPPSNSGERAGSALSRYNTVTSARPPTQQSQAQAVHLQQAPERYSSPFGGRRYSSMAPPPPPPPPNGNSGTNLGATGSGGQHAQHSEHAKLMMDSLAMFESHLSKVPQLAGTGGTGQELVKGAQGIALAAEKLNGLLRSGTSRALEEQIDAEVDGDSAGGRDLIEVWRRVGGEYREGLRVSDELVRGVTGFLLGVGRIVRDFGGSVEGVGHERSVSLGEERARGTLSPETNSGSGRKSADSRRSWEPGREREETLRRISGRSDSVLGTRPPSAFNTLRERDLDSRYETPAPPAAKTGPRNSTGTVSSGSVRRLFTPREQREQQEQEQQRISHDTGSESSSRGMATARLQEGLDDYEPSPTPTSRQQSSNATLDRNRVLPALSIPKPLPTLPSESSLRRSQTTATPDSRAATIRDRDRERDRDRRKISVASVATVRAAPTFPAISTPNATTAITTHTVVSGSPDQMTFPLLRTASGKERSTVTFSRPSTVSVSALSGLQQQHFDQERKRTSSNTSSGGGGERGSGGRKNGPVPVTPLSGSEMDRGPRSKTVGSRNPRASLDGPGEEGENRRGRMATTVNAADRSAVSAILPQLNPGKRERRRTVNEIWPRD